jgi:hypothetical protein
MREDVRQALAIDASSTIEDRTIDITTTGRRSGEPRRIEIAFYRLGDPPPHAVVSRAVPATAAGMAARRSPSRQFRPRLPPTSSFIS